MKIIIVLKLYNSTKIQNYIELEINRYSYYYMSKENHEFVGIATIYALIYIYMFDLIITILVIFIHSKVTANSGVWYVKRAVKQ